jgi:hypothetical protein
MLPGTPFIWGLVSFFSGLPHRLLRNPESLPRAGLGDYAREDTATDGFGAKTCQIRNSSLTKRRQSFRAKP